MAGAAYLELCCQADVRGLHVELHGNARITGLRVRSKRKGGRTLINVPIVGTGDHAYDAAAKQALAQLRRTSSV